MDFSVLFKEVFAYLISISLDTIYNNIYLVFCKVCVILFEKYLYSYNNIVMADKIKIVGAKEHNLKNVSLEIPKNELVVFTGVSGSGKSSLAFDTIFAEGQRRYIESLSTYARQF